MFQAGEASLNLLQSKIDRLELLINVHDTPNHVAVRRFRIPGHETR